MPVNQSKLRLAPTLLSQLTGMFKLAIVLQLDSKKKKEKRKNTARLECAVWAVVEIPLHAFTLILGCVNTAGAPQLQAVSWDHIHTFYGSSLQSLNPSLCCKLSGWIFPHVFFYGGGMKSSKDWGFHIGCICTTCHSWFSSADVSCLAQLPCVLSLHSTLSEAWGQTGTVFLFNEPTDNGLWGPWRDMTQIALSSDWD